MYPQRSHRECDVSQRIRAPQLSQSMSSIAPILPPAGRLSALRHADRPEAARARSVAARVAEVAAEATRFTEVGAEAAPVVGVAT